jgi:N-acyl-D-aspartate/D-glutamate deacylase
MRIKAISLLSLSLLLAACGEKPAADSRPFDLLITNARVLDGMGNPWYRADVAVRDGAIVEIGRLEGREAHRAIDAAGRVLSPGFIDMMGGRTYPLLEDPDAAESKLRQGITTMLAGEGTSEAPQTAQTIAEMPLAARLGISWTTYAEYDQLLEKQGLRLNVIHTVGAGQVRQVVMGEQDGRPTPEQMAEMKSLVRKAMEDGAAGLSTALIYPPGTYATSSEIAELAKETAPYSGVYFTHMRNESSKVLEAIQEAIDIGKQAGVPVHIFHLKAAGQDDWPLMEQSISLIETTRAQGFDVTADIYPYVRNGIGLGSFLHPRHYAEGADTFLATLPDPEVRRALRREVETTSDWENWYRHVGMNWDNVLVAQVSGSLDKTYEGKSVAQIAKIRNSDEWTAFFDLVAAGGVSVNPKSMNEEQKHLALRAEFISVDTDASPTNANDVSSAHPRAFGAFARILAKYVRDEKVISLENAVRKMTSLPANRLGLYGRGHIAPGMQADLLIFDPEKVQDNATFESPVAYATGFDYVIVNGQLVIDDNTSTQSRPGQVLARR